MAVVVAALLELGGLATRRALIDMTSRADVDRALRKAQIVAVARGRYSLPSVLEAERTAHQLSGLLSHTSAALHHGWEVKLVPELPHVTVPRKRRPSAAGSKAAQLHYCDVPLEDVSGGIAKS